MFKRKVSNSRKKIDHTNKTNMSRNRFKRSKINRKPSLNNNKITNQTKSRSSKKITLWTITTKMKKKIMRKNRRKLKLRKWKRLYKKRNSQVSETIINQNRRQR